MRKVIIRGLLILASFGICVLFAQCGGSGGTSPTNNKPMNTTGNVQPIAVNGGPLPDSSSSFTYPNAAFTSVTICDPGTSTCQTIDGILVDTGSSGLRLLSSAFTLSLKAQTINGNPLAEYIQFVDGSYVWGPVRIADVKMAGETAGSVPIHVLQHDFYTIPYEILSSAGIEVDDLQGLGANGILGVGSFQQDCGDACAQSPTGGLQSIEYYECSSGGCTPVSVPLHQQVQNPVAFFPKDNNGVIITLPVVSGTEAMVSGSLIFGIGTQSNNGLGGAAVYTLNQDKDFTTIYKNKIMPYSFIDSGSNCNNFMDNTIQQCSQDYVSGYYCPSATLSLSAINQGANGTKGTTQFSVGDASKMFDGPTSDNYAFSGLAGPSDASETFDWGLPFFYGRTVYTAIEGKDTPAGQGPYWAY
jgi:hypothetical protein